MSLRSRVLQALNEIRTPSTAGEITEKLNRQLDKGEKPFTVRAVARQLLRMGDVILALYWLESRPRRLG
jgi:predicted Zn-ribbon and HTH transcriptional regulator